jgi:hypothetical protein
VSRVRLILVPRAKVSLISLAGVGGQQNTADEELLGGLT